jgi:hypothetical protein
MNVHAEDSRTNSNIFVFTLWNFSIIVKYVELNWLQGTPYLLQTGYKCLKYELETTTLNNSKYLFTVFKGTSKDGLQSVALSVWDGGASAIIPAGGY